MNMTTTRKKFNFWVYDKEVDLRLFLESRVNVSDFVKDILEKFRTRKLVDAKTIDLQRKKLEVDIRYKEIMIKIKEKELLFVGTFDETPSPRAKIAIKQAVNTESYEPPEEKKIKDVIQNNWNKFVESIIKNPKNEWALTCGLCSTGFILPTRDQAIQRFKTHLLETHYQKVLDLNKVYEKD